MAVAYGSLPFSQQIAFFRDKVNLPSQDWTQLWQQGHDHAFVVAGAQRDELVADLRAAVDKAISEGTTIATFRKDFADIVARHGWAYNGGFNWRSRVIYDTNIRTSYAAGRYAQLQAVKDDRPYWRYVHAEGEQDPRLQHLAWNGLILHADSPWWHTHYPPNGWGCRCTVEALSESDLQRLGKSGPDQAPAMGWRTVKVGTRGAHPRTVRVPDGIDPGFAYAPGATAWTQPLAEQAMSAGESYAASDWERLITTTWRDYARPERVPLADAPVPLSKPAKGIDQMRAAVVHALGGQPYRVYDVHGVPVAVDAETLARHTDPARAQYLPLLDDAMTHPYEVWLSLERDRRGYYVLRSRLIKAYSIRGGRAVLLVAQQANGFLEGWTFMPVRQMGYLDKQRMGRLLYGE